MVNFIKTRKTFSLILLTAVVLVGFYIVWKQSDDSLYDFAIASRSDLVHEVAVTGRVKPSQSVDLAFEKSGKVASVRVDVGDTVFKFQTLVSLVNADLAAQLLQAEANFDITKAELSEMEIGARPEEVQIAETKVTNAENTLLDAEENVQNVINKAAVDIDQDYSASLIAAQTSLSVSDNALIIASDLQRAYFGTSSQEGSKIITAVNIATSEVNNIAKPAASIAVNDFTQANVDTALAATLSAINKVKDALDVIPTPTRMSSADKIILNAQKVLTDAEISTISGKIQTIVVQKATNVSNISTAEASASTAESALSSAEKELLLKKAGATPQQIEAQKAKVKAAEANVQNIRAQLARTILSSPLKGIVTKQIAKIGEIIVANMPVVSLISESQFEIEASIPEIDISKIALGNDASITLDAYGNDVVFGASVVTIDPAETLIDGVPTYKIVLQFVEKDQRIKSGMTANIDIKTSSREDVITIPQRAVLRRNGSKFVRVIDSPSSPIEDIREVIVETGLVGLDGNIEIVQGINVGDIVIVFIND